MYLVILVMVVRNTYKPLQKHTRDFTAKGAKKDVCGQMKEIAKY